MLPARAVQTRWCRLTEPVWVDSAGIWQHAMSSGPCRQCGTTAAAGYATTLDDPVDGPFCSLAHWALHADTTATITGGSSRPLPARTEPAEWDTIAPTLVPTGPRGITEHPYRHGVVLVYRSETGSPLGALIRSRYNEWTVVVDPDHRHHGIGKRLVRAAGRRWGINLDHQRLTPKGQALTRAALPKTHT